METLAKVKRNQLLVARLTHREFSAAEPGKLADVEEASEWFVPFEQTDPTWTTLTAVGRPASIRVLLREPAFSVAWEIRTAD